MKSLSLCVGVQVVAVDQVSDGLRATAQLNITVLDYNDNAPQFPPIPDPLRIPEGHYSEEKPGEVYTIVPTDADLGPNGEVTLTLASPHPLFRFREVRPGERRSVGNVSGAAALSSCVVLQDGTLLVVGALDRESRDTYELVVKAADRGSPQREVRDGHFNFLRCPFIYWFHFPDGLGRLQVSDKIMF